MIRVVHLFNVRKAVQEEPFVEWLEARLDTAARRFGCVDRKTWLLLDGFEGSYQRPKSAAATRPKYVIEAYWPDQRSAEGFRDWLLTTEEGRALHQRWFDSVTDHTTLRYVEGMPLLSVDA